MRKNYLCTVVLELFTKFSRSLFQEYICAPAISEYLTLSIVDVLPDIIPVDIIEMVDILHFQSLHAHCRFLSFVHFLCLLLCGDQDKTTSG